MGKLLLGIGALAGAAFLVQYALSEATHQVMEPGVERATANAEAFAEVGQIAQQQPAAAAEDPALTAFYGETADDEAGEPEYDSTAE
jgi:hypothetical protein